MLPDPLHPAVVHFPIALLLLGAPLAVVAVFVRSWNLPVLAAVVLALGGGGALVATWTGGQAAELAGELNGGGEQVLDQHEEWGGRARNAGIVAAVLAVASASLFRKPVAARSPVGCSPGATYQSMSAPPVVSNQSSWKGYSPGAAKRSTTRSTRGAVGSA